VSFDTTADVKLPKDPFERIIGQEDAVKIARLIAKQKRNLLLVGPPGTGKSMIAQAISSVLPKPKYDVSVLHNEKNPERPIIEIRSVEQIEKQSAPKNDVGHVVSSDDIPFFVSEKLGFRCRRCGASSNYTINVCPSCGADKIFRRGILLDSVSPSRKQSNTQRIATTKRNADGREEQIIYERMSDGKIKILTRDDLKKLEEINKKSMRKSLVSLNRSMFIQASGASETELLGDVRHDPYGGHHHLGTPPYKRVVPGALHEAHEGVLFLDEMSTLGAIQRYLLTAMQDKSFPIVGRNPTSSGAAVRVDGVPCDFILVGSININDLQTIMPPLRSRIRGDGYEVLMKTFMEDTKENRIKIAQFVTQEIKKDGKIPHATKETIDILIKEAKRIAKEIDNASGITLRLRLLAGIIRMAGDLAVLDESKFIEKKHILGAIKNSKSIEEQLNDKYGSVWKAGTSDFASKSPKSGAETA